jgi:hypothetical protein
VAAPVSDDINLAFVSTETAVYAVDLTTHQTARTTPHPGRLALSENGVLQIVLTDASDRSTGAVGAINLK